MFKWYYYLMMVAFATLTPLWGTTPAAAADQEAGQEAEQGMSPVNSRDDSAAPRDDSAADENDGFKNLAKMMASFSLTPPHTGCSTALST